MLVPEQAWSSVFSTLEPIGSAWSANEQITVSVRRSAELEVLRKVGDFLDKDESLDDILSPYRMYRCIGQHVWAQVHS